MPADETQTYGVVSRIPFHSPVATILCGLKPCFTSKSEFRSFVICLVSQ